MKPKHSFLALLITLTLLSAGYSVAASVTIPSAWEPRYNQGVEFYRNGDYVQANTCFQDVTTHVPESQEAQYYAAISLAQLGRVKDARTAYQRVITLSPGTDAAKLAQEGLDNLPTANSLDTPPKLHAPTATASGTGATAAPAAAATAAPAMDPKMMQMMMMMSAMGGGGGGNNGMGMMMMPMLQKMMGNPSDPNADPNESAIPADAMKTMMMNQMMQNFNPLSNGKDDH